MAKIYYGTWFGTDRTVEDEQALCRLAAAAVFNLPGVLAAEKPVDRAVPAYLQLPARRLAVSTPRGEDADL